MPLLLSTLGAKTSAFLYTSSFGLEWAIVALLAILVFFPRPLVAFVVMLLFLRLDERFILSVPILYSAYISLLLSIIIHLRSLFISHLNNGDKALFLFAAVVLVETAVFYRWNFLPILKDYGLGSAYYLSLVLFIKDSKGLKALNYALILAAAVICFEPLYYYFTEPAGSPILAHFVGHEGRLNAWGLWKNANETSFIAFLGVANIFLVLVGRKFSFARMILLVPLLSMFVTTVILTVSRTGMGCILLLLLTACLFAQHLTLKLGAICLLAAGLVFAPIYLRTRTEMESSSTAREDLRYTGRHIFFEHPIVGVGIGEARHQPNTGGQPLHNTFLQAFAETGIIGGLLILFTFFETGRRLFKIFIMNKTNQIIRVTSGVLMGVFISSIIYFFFGNQLFSLMFLTVLAIIRITISTTDKALVQPPNLSNESANII
jgi:O-antigen ligase